MSEHDLDTVTISPMRARHLPEVLAIEAQVYPRPWSARLFEEELERPNRVYLVARLGATVVGYGGLLMIADDGHIATIAVEPTHQRQGVARSLLVELVRGALRLGAQQLTLEVRMSNQGAQDLYRSLGFAPGGARKAYYSDNGEDALVMWAHDITAPEYEERLLALAARSPRPVARQGLAPAEAAAEILAAADATADSLHPALAAADPGAEGEAS